LTVDGRIVREIKGRGKRRGRTLCVPQMDYVMAGMEGPVRADIADVGASGTNGG